MKLRKAPCLTSYCDLKRVTTLALPRARALNKLLMYRVSTRAYSVRLRKRAVKKSQLHVYNVDEHLGRRKRGRKNVSILMPETERLSMMERACLNDRQ